MDPKLPAQILEFLNRTEKERVDTVKAVNDMRQDLAGVQTDVRYTSEKIMDVRNDVKELAQAVTAHLVDPVAHGKPPASVEPAAKKWTKSRVWEKIVQPAIIILIAIMTIQGYRFRSPFAPDAPVVVVHQGATR